MWDELAWLTNEGMAEVTAWYPKRMIGMATVVLGHPTGRRGRRSAGRGFRMRGVVVQTNADRWPRCRARSG